MSSTNKTPHLALNQWVPDDPPLREDFNTDNLRIDGAVGALMAVTADLPDKKPGFAAYTVPGVFSFTVPKTTNYLVEVVGGGGLSADTRWSTPSWGGGGGAYAKKLVPLTKGDVVTVTVGAAANNGINPSYSPSGGGYWNGAGGASSFGAYVTAPGGVNNMGGVATTGDVNISGTICQPDPPYIPGVSFMGSSGAGTAAGFGAGNGNHHATLGESSGATGGCCLITWI